MAEAAGASRPSFREGEEQLDRAASVLDLGTDIPFREVLRIFARVVSTFRLFKARIATKLGFITVELVFRLMVAPWPGKVVVDHIILGAPIGDASGFPAYLAPAVLLLDGMGPVEMMLWVFLLGVFMVTVFGFTTSRGAGRSPSGAPTGASAGSSGGATALTPQGHGTLAQGHDIATQTENLANMGSGLMAGILGFLDFRVHLRLSQSMNHFLRTRVARKLRSLPMTTLDDLRIGDSVYRVLYDTTSANMLLHGIALGLYSGLLGVVITLSIMFTYFGAAPEVIVLGMLALPIVFLIELPFARMARRRGQASRASGSSTTSNIEEGMSNVLAVQSLGGNERESRRFRRASEESFKRFRTEWFLVLTYRQAFSLALMLSQVVFFIVMAGRVIDGTFTAGDYFVLTYYFFVLSATFGAWGFMYTEWQRDIAGMRRVFFLMDLPAEKARDGVQLDRIKRGIEMKGVGLVYPDGRRALRDVDLEARIGEIVAFVGPTGAGGHRHRVALAFLVVADRRHTLPVEEAVAAVHAVEKPRWMVAPMKQVRTRHVAPVVGLLAQASVLEDVEEVVPALPVDGPVRVEGHRDAFRHDEVVARSCRVAQDALAECAGAFGERVGDLRERSRHASPRAVRLPRHPELEGAVPGRRTELHGVDGCRVSVDDHLGVVQHEALVVVAAPVGLLLQLLPQIGLRRAGAASPGLGKEGDLSVDVTGPCCGVVGL